VNPLVMAATMEENGDNSEASMKRRFSMQRARVAVPQVAARRKGVTNSTSTRASRSLQVQAAGSARESLGRLKAYSHAVKLEPRRNSSAITVEEAAGLAGENLSRSQRIASISDLTSVAENPASGDDSDT
jgi:uncharacterized protein YigA (DUF484 family)